MNARDRGFLLLASSLGDSNRHPLTVAQMRTLAKRVQNAVREETDRELQEKDLAALGYGQEMCRRILQLLSQEDVLDYYLQKAKRYGCIPITRADSRFPKALRSRLGLDSPGVLWAKGDVSLLERPMISLVGSRNISSKNRDFAGKAGAEIPRQGYVLVSGNARGADRIAQDSCLAEGGQVIVVAADSLEDKPETDRVLYLSEDSFDLPFSAQRALSRNAVIHCLGERVLVAQCDYQTGGTWSGTSRNLSGNLSPVFCFDDGSVAARALEQMGAQLIGLKELEHFAPICQWQRNFLDE